MIIFFGISEAKPSFLDKIQVRSLYSFLYVLIEILFE